MTAAAVAAEAAAAEARAASWWWRRPGCRHTATLCTPPLPKTACCFCWLLFAFPPAYPVAVISVVASAAFRRHPCLFCPRCCLSAPYLSCLGRVVAVDGWLMFTPLMYLLCAAFHTPRSSGLLMRWLLLLLALLLLLSLLHSNTCGTGRILAIAITSARCQGS